MTQRATFAAGCFWGVEAGFREIDGVIDAISGYTGGDTANPTYREVCEDRTGHAEAVEVTFDATRVSYETLVQQFLTMHDPTQVNRQGPDVGSQYRSAIFFHSPEQERVAHAVIANAQTGFPRPISTQVVAAAPFYRAEEYHQRYFERNEIACHVSPQ